jgi:hypothetical protein
MSVIYINPYVFSAVAYDADAAAYIALVEGASGDNQPLEAAVKDAINSYVVSLKLNSIWTDAIQLLLPCGPRTLAGALIPLKGTAPTNSGTFVTGDYNRKLGLTGSGTKYLNSNVLATSLPSATHALAWYGSITENTTPDKALIGAYNAVTQQSIIMVDSWTGYVSGRAFRSATFSAGNFPVSTSTASADCLIGTRTALNSATLYVNGTATTNTATVSPAFDAYSFYWFALNNANTPASYSGSRLAAGGIYTIGMNSTQAAAFRSAGATYLAALDTAIP